jgi:3-oxoacyl-[acyl-carrier protein] reductase
VSKTAPRTAIVTGGARGIGRGCALELARRGYDIALVDLLEPEMKRTQGEIEGLGRKALTYQADVASFARAHEVADDVARQWGGIDFLLNDAGASNAKGILEIKEEEFDRMLKQEGGGRIASMSSLNALSGGVTSAVSKHAYAAAKAGILGLTRSLAKELGPRIMINAICPGVIETELGNSLTKSRGEEMKKGIMLDRLGTPADVAQLVAFLATSEPCFITGQHFVIDGFQWSC